MKFDYYLVIDLEATCCDQGTIRREETEIIEIGAVIADARTLASLDDFTTFIRPIRHPRLTEFCTELTGITQTDVDDAPRFREALVALVDWLAEYPNHLFCSWGDYDRKQLERECRFHKVVYPFPDGHLNLKQQFSDRLGVRKRFGMAGALRKVGLDLQGTHHRGIDDARNIAKLLPYAVGTEPD